MRLSELIAAHGDDKVQFQNLDACMESAALTKLGSKVTFVTPERLTPNGFPKLCLIVWMDRDRVKELIEAPRKEKAP